MQRIIETLKQSLVDQHVPSEQIQNILSSVDMSQLNVHDLPATQEYLSQFLAGFDLRETVTAAVSSGLLENLGMHAIPGLEAGGDIMGEVGNMISGFFGDN